MGSWISQRSAEVEDAHDPHKCPGAIVCRYRLVDLIRYGRELNEVWHAAHVDLGRNAKAAKWRAKQRELNEPAPILP